MNGTNEALSPRQREILDRVAAGRTSKEIAADLGIAESTVKWHLANAYTKLGAASRAEAVARILRGEGPPPPHPLPLLTWWRVIIALVVVAAIAMIAGGVIVSSALRPPPVPITTPRPTASSTTVEPWRPLMPPLADALASEPIRSVHEGEPSQAAGASVVGAAPAPGVGAAVPSIAWIAPATAPVPIPSPTAPGTAPVPIASPAAISLPDLPKLPQNAGGAIPLRVTFGLLTLGGARF